MVPEAMRAAWLLKEEYAIETRVVNVHTVKPLDIPTLVRAAEETRVVVTAEEHQVGGFGNIVAGAILQQRKDFRLPLQLAMVGVADRFGISGNPWELVQHFGLTAEHLAKRVLDLLARKLASFAPSAPIASTEARQFTVPAAAPKSHPLNMRRSCPCLPTNSAPTANTNPWGCAPFAIEWGKVSHNSPFICPACRANPVLR